MRARAVEGLHEGDEQLNNEVPMGSICCHTVSHWHRLVALDGSAQGSCCCFFADKDGVPPADVHAK